MVKDAMGRIVKADRSGCFARLAGLSQTELLGSTTADFPWGGSTAQKVKAADSLVRLGEVREAVGIYWHPLDNNWRRVVSAKWLVEDAVSHRKSNSNFLMEL